MFSVEVNNLELLSIVQNGKLSLFYWLCPPAMTNLGRCFQTACRENTLRTGWAGSYGVL